MVTYEVPSWEPTNALSVTVKDAAGVCAVAVAGNAQADATTADSASAARRQRMVFNCSPFRDGGCNPRGSTRRTRYGFGARRRCAPRRCRTRRGGALHAQAVEDGGLDAGGDRLGGEADFLVQERGRAVGDVAVGQADAQDARGDRALLGEGLPDG